MLFFKKKQEQKGLVEQYISDIMSGNSSSDSWNGYDYQQNIKNGYEKSVYVYKAVKRRMDTAASIPIRVYKKGKDGNDELDTTHPMNKLLEEINEYYTFDELVRRYVMTKIFATKWNAVIARMGDKPTGEPVKLFHVFPSMVQIIKNNLGYTEAYNINGVVYPRESVLEIKNISGVDMNEGMPEIMPGATTIRSRNKAEIFNEKSLDRGFNPGGVFETDQYLDTENYKTVRDQLNNSYLGLKEVGKFLLAHGGLKFKQTQMAHKDILYNLLMQMSAEDISILLGVPLPLISMKAATFDNMKTAERQMYTDSSIPDIKSLCDELNKKVANYWKKDNVYFWYDLKDIAVLNDDTDKLYDRILKAVDRDVITLEAAAVLLDLPENPAIGNVTLSEHRQGMVDVIPETDEVTKSIKSIKKTMATVSDIDEDMILGIIKKIEKEYQESIGKVYKDTINLSAQSWIKTLNGTVEYNPVNQSIQTYVKTVSVNRIKGVDTTTYNRIMGQISEGIANGDDWLAMEMRIANEFDIAQQWRVPMIAATETHNATQYGVLDAYRQSGIVDFKEWITERDDKVREAHQGMEGVQVKIDDMFDVEGNDTDYPGNTGIPELDINCRCTTAAIFNDDAGELSAGTYEAKTMEWKRQDTIARSKEKDMGEAYSAMMTAQKNAINTYLKGLQK